MASQNDATAPVNQTTQSGRYSSPPPTGIKQRSVTRAATSTDNARPLNRRRSSIFSEGISETRKSFRSSADDLLLPRPYAEVEAHAETSHWHSLPLGLALLPAVAGLFFKDGSAIITDLTLLGLAAIFLNWALRIPWDWYHTAQAVVVESVSPGVCTPIEEEEEAVNFETSIDGDKEQASGNSPKPKSDKMSGSTMSQAARMEAQRELRIHGILALTACFVSPVLGAWLLHAIRSQLSRPSEGLVSNYNLSIFLLVAEVRPLSHLMKMIQRRTLHLQKRVMENPYQDQEGSSSEKSIELMKRLDELEAHVANSVPPPSAHSNGVLTSTDDYSSKISAQISTEMRKNMQPELDALNRAMRRYEKRMTISAIQTEARLQDLEVKLQDVVVLAAAAQRNADRHHRGYIMIMTNWLCAAVVVPIQYFISLLALPSKMVSAMSIRLKRILGREGRSGGRDLKSTARSLSSRQKAREKRVKASS